MTLNLVELGVSLRPIWIVVLAIALATFAVRAAATAVEQKDGVSLTWLDILQGMEHGREGLESGICVIEGTEMPAGINVPLRFSAFNAFNHASGQTRLDHKWLNAKHVQDESSEEPGSKRVVCETKESTYQYSSASQSQCLYICPPGTVKLKGVSGTAGFLDVRTLGMIGFDDMYKSVSLSAAVDSLRELRPQEISIVPNEDGIVLVTMKFHQRRFQFVIDAANGFTLLNRKVEVGVWADTGAFTPLSEYARQSDTFSKKIASGEIAESSLIDVPEEVEVQWQRQGGTYVPVSYRGIHRSLTSVDGADGVRVRETAFQLTWSSVNEQVDKSIFDYHNFELPDGTTVFQRTGGESVFVEMIGSTRSDGEKLIRKSQSARILLIALNVILVVVVVWMLWHRWKNKERVNG